MSVCVVTDSSGVMPAAWVSDLPIHIVALEIAWADGTLEPGNLAYSAIATKLVADTVAPKTGAPAPGMYTELLERLLADHVDGVLVVCPAAELSTTYSSATIGARDLGDSRVRVLDAKTAAAGQGLVAAEAARAAADGRPLEEVSARAISVAGRMNIWATLARLDFLRRSGRLPAIATIGADALGLQPIVRYAGGSPALAGVARNDRRANDRLFAAWERSIVPGSALRALAFHSARDDDARDLIQRVRARVPDATADLVEVTASLASHTGPGLLGLAWFWDN